MSAAAAPFRPVLLAASKEFNAGRYFEAHEVLEDGLEQVPDDLWDLFLGLIQIAVGYHKATLGLASGAARMLGMGLKKVEGFAADAGDLNLEALRNRVRLDIQRIRDEQLDADDLARNPPRIQPLPSEPV